jgi:hypothetical protein
LETATAAAKHVLATPATVLPWGVAAFLLSALGLLTPRQLLAYRRRQNRMTALHEPWGDVADAPASASELAPIPAAVPEEDTAQPEANSLRHRLWNHWGLGRRLDHVRRRRNH